MYMCPETREGGGGELTMEDFEKEGQRETESRKREGKDVSGGKQRGKGEYRGVTTKKKIKDAGIEGRVSKR